MLESVLNSVLELWTQFTTYSKSNPVIAGVVGLWGLSVATFVLKQVPTIIMNTIERQLTVTVSIHNADTAFYYCDYWCYQQKFTNTFRSLRVVGTNWGDKTIGETSVTAGYGTHWFFYKWRLIKYNRVREEATGTQQNKETITFTTFGRSQSTIRLLLADIESSYVKNEVLKIYEWETDRWQFAGEAPKRPWNSITTNDGIKEEILGQLTKFLDEDEQAWKLENGIHNKITIQLEGPPGTGKTSIVRAIASKLSRNIHVLSLSSISDNGLKKALSSAGKNSIILIEDIDSSSATKSREKSKNKSDGNAPITLLEDWSMITIQGILNALDGISSSNGRIIFTTTNHPEKIDPAILRKGRINYRFIIDYMNNDSINSYLKKFFPNVHLKLKSNKYVDKLTTATLEGHLLDYRENIDSILEKIIVK
ncbi:MAG: AAA family ATPase [Candidatus Peribacteraceae bacterium]|nr:AAA family ATPase [Candidatus Peribacteraceae bacterium]